ncbi:ABC transporter permease [Bacillus thuringiensis]|nr:ABC transporter permease [Bacillus thuringiensis]
MNKKIRNEDEHSSIELSYNRSKNIQHKVPFCCTISVPKGWEVLSACHPKIVYQLDCLSIIKETCRKTVEVKDCGQTEIDVNVLKIKGCISFLMNIEVNPKDEQCICFADSDNQDIALCCKDTVCVDHVLQCSVGPLHLNCHNVTVCDVKVVPVCDEACQFVKVTGNFQLHPHF